MFKVEKWTDSHRNGDQFYRTKTLAKSSIFFNIPRVECHPRVERAQNQKIIRVVVTETVKNGQKLRFLSFRKKQSFVPMWKPKNNFVLERIGSCWNSKNVTFDHFIAVPFNPKGHSRLVNGSQYFFLILCPFHFHAEQEQFERKIVSFGDSYTSLPQSFWCSNCETKLSVPQDLLLLSIFFFRYPVWFTFDPFIIVTM